MKKIAFLILTASVPVIMSFAPGGDNGAATVERIEGVYVFVDSRPIAEYDYLGTVKAGSGMGKAFSVSSQEYEDRRNKLIKRVKEEYPNADGVILKFKSGGKDAADAIKFK